MQLIIYSLVKNKKISANFAVIKKGADYLLKKITYLVNNL